MKVKNLMLLSCLVLFFACQQKSATVDPSALPSVKAKKAADTPKTHPATLVETIAYDLNQDGKTDSILVWASDSTSFDKAAIKVSGLAPSLFEKEDGYAAIDTSFLKNNHNSIKSNRLFVYRHKGECIVMLFTHVRDGGYDGPTLVSIKKDAIYVNVPKDIEIPIRITDLNRDGIADFVGVNWGEMVSQVDSLDASIGTYNPYYVYSLTDSCKINKALTEQYNKEHYVWAGLTNTENIRVLYPRNGGKPKLVK